MSSVLLDKVIATMSSMFTSRCWSLALFLIKIRLNRGIVLRYRDLTGMCLLEQRYETGENLQH